MVYDTQTSSRTPDNLVLDGYPLKRGARTLSTGNLARGSVLGKILYTGSVTAAADAGNTGDGTCTVLSMLPGAGKIPSGAYNLECTAAVTNGGTFKLEDPTGQIVSANLTMTVGAGAATIFEAGGIKFTLTDGATDFIVGDLFVVNVVAGSGSVTLLDKTAVDGSQYFDSILLDATDASSATKKCPVAEAGEFDTRGLVFASGTVYGDVTEQMRDANCYLNTTNALVGV